MKTEQLVKRELIDSDSDSEKVTIDFNVMNPDRWWMSSETKTTGINYKPPRARVGIEYQAVRLRYY